MAKNTEVKNTEVTLKETPAVPMLLDMESDAGMGLENLSAKDFAIPFLGLLQSLSPQTQRGPNQIVGASAGDIFNPVNQKVIPGDQGMLVIPCAYQMKWVEWTPRESGGGFVRYHESEAVLDSCSRNDKNFDILPNGNSVIPTAYYYVLIVHPDGMTEKAILPMPRTQLKKARKWNSIIATLKVRGKAGLYTPPMFSHIYLLTTTLESNKVGTWFTWQVAVQGPITDANLYQEAKDFSKDIQTGTVKAAPPEADIPAAEETHM